jgi:hypothetical protein
LERVFQVSVSQNERDVYAVFTPHLSLFVVNFMPTAVDAKVPPMCIVDATE